MLNSNHVKNAEPFYLDRPLNFAHRGASHQAPANTLAAFLLAAELGADGIELDAQLSKDGEVVVIHDFTLEGTTDGMGLVRSKTLAELRELDAGSWFDPAFAGQRIPTLQEVADAVGHRLLLNVELKTTGMRDEGLAAEALRIIEDNHLIASTVVSSFNPFALRRARQLNPHVSTGLLYAPDQPIWLRRAWLRSWIQPEALHPHHSIVTTDYVQWAKSHGYHIHTWTVDEPEEVRRLTHCGVDLIITNQPDLVGQILAGAEQSGSSGGGV